jgi:small subunit ribosomal protein S6
MYIVDVDQADEQVEAIVEKYKKVVTDNGGVVGNTGKWEHGRRRLAYEVDGRREGLYLLMNFEGDNEVPKELDRIFRISDDVLRHMIVLPDEHVAPANIGPITAPKQEEAPASAPAAAETAPAPASGDAAGEATADDTSDAPTADASADSTETADAATDAPAAGGDTGGEATADDTDATAGAAATADAGDTATDTAGTGETPGAVEDTQEPA